MLHVAVQQPPLLILIPLSARHKPLDPNSSVYTAAQDGKCFENNREQEADVAMEMATSP